MSEWTVNLELDEGMSSKFWRGRVEGSTLFVSHGRVGSTGQTTVHDFGSRVFATRELDKLVRELRRKGYRDAAASGPIAAIAHADPPPAGAKSGGVRLVLGVGGRNVTATLHLSGNTITMESSETYDSADVAKHALERLKKALASEGYEER